MCDFPMVSFTLLSILRDTLLRQVQSQRKQLIYFAMLVWTFELFTLEKETSLSVVYSENGQEFIQESLFNSFGVKHFQYFSSPII